MVVACCRDAVMALKLVELVTDGCCALVVCHVAEVVRAEVELVSAVDVEDVTEGCCALVVSHVVVVLWLVAAVLSDVVSSACVLDCCEESVAEEDTKLDS